MIVVAKFGSSFNAAANSLRVFNVAGALSIKLAIAVSTSDLVYMLLNAVLFEAYEDKSPNLANDSLTGIVTPDISPNLDKIVLVSE